MPAVLHHLRPAPGVTEIRVHGVGGATPEALLEQTGVRQVTGDDKAGMFRGAVETPGRSVEAYSWGGLTARSRSRALWVVLLPFSLVNLAGWMVEPPEDNPLERTPGTKWHEMFVQFIALATTAMYVMWAAHLAMNVLAAQCGAIPECRDGRWYLEFLGADFFAGHPGRRVLAGLAVPLALLATFVVLSEVSSRRYDDYGRAQRPAIAQDDEQGGSVLGLVDFWYPSTWQRLTARLHVAAAFLVLGGFLGMAAGEFGTRFGVDVLPDGLGRMLFVVAVVALAGLLTGLGLATWRSGRLLAADGRGFAVFTHATLGVATAVLAVVCWATWRLDVADVRLVEPVAPGAGAVRPGWDLWGFGWAPILLLAVAAAFIGLFSVVQMWRWIVWRRMFLDQFVVVVMLLLVVLWQWAGWIALAAAVLAVASQWLPDVVARFVPEARGPAYPLRPLAVVVGTCAASLVTWWWTRGAASPWGAGWPRLTPVLLFTAILVGLGIGEAGRRATRVLVAVPAVTIGLGWLLSAWLGRDEWLYGAALLAWVVTGVAWLARFQFDGYDRWRWNGPAAVAVFALTLVMGSMSGLVIWLVDVLDRDGTSFVLRATAVYEWVAIAFSAMLVVTAAGLATWYASIRLGTAATRDGARLPKSEALPEALRAVDVVVTMGSLLMVAGVLALVVHLRDRYGTAYERWLDDGAPTSWRGIVQVASWVAVGVAVGAVFAVRRGLRDHAFRTRFGIVWDVASFWPRAFHPFAPPAYATRAIPEIQARLTEVATATEPGPDGARDGAAILSGHSQGSVISLAAIASLRPEVRAHVRLVTHGCPLARFYRKCFPRYFPDALFEHCAAALGPTDEVTDGSWLNFWRRTDPIGGPVFDDQVRESTLPDALGVALDLSDSRRATMPDVRLVDPADDDANPYVLRRRPTPRGHSGYMADPAMALAIDALAAELARPGRPRRRRE